MQTRVSLENKVVWQKQAWNYVNNVIIETEREMEIGNAVGLGLFTEKGLGLLYYFIFHLFL